MASMWCGVACFLLGLPSQILFWWLGSKPRTLVIAPQRPRSSLSLAVNGRLASCSVATTSETFFFLRVTTSETCPSFSSVFTHTISETVSFSLTIISYFWGRQDKSNHLNNHSGWRWFFLAGNVFDGTVLCMGSEGHHQQDSETSWPSSVAATPCGSIPESCVLWC